LRAASKSYVTGLENLRLYRPGDFWRLLRRPAERLAVDTGALHEHYTQLLATVPEHYEDEELLDGPPGGEPFSAEEI